MCLVVGDTGVGKSCLITTYTTNVFPSEDACIPLVKDKCYFSDVTVKGIPLILHMWDIGGSCMQDGQRQLLYSMADVFVVCFSLVNPASLENVRSKWYPEISSFSAYTPIILVGTKCDLRQKKKLGSSMLWSSDPITESVGRQMGREIGAVKYVECSAMTKLRLEKVFEEAAKAAPLHRHPQNKKVKCPSCSYL